jgi:putative hemolysin
MNMEAELTLINWEFALLGICLVLSAVFSGLETAITSLGPLKTKHLIEEDETGLTKHLELWRDYPGRVITTILVFNNVVNIFGASLTTKIAIQMFGHVGVGIATGVTTFAILVFGEVIPKSFAKAHCERLGVPSLHFVRFLYLASFPLVFILSWVTGRIIGSLSGKDQSLKPTITREEIEFFINEGESEGVIKKLKKDMISSVFEFDETLVREIMKPRRDCVMIEISEPMDEVLKATIRTGYSRIPIYEGSMDSIVGIVHAKDLLRVAYTANGEMPKIEDVMREAYFVPETKAIMDVFRDLKRTKNHLAIVIDEHGGTDGLVTLEDILEEIVGEIQDEFDVEKATVLKIADNTYDVAGSMNIEDFCSYFDIDEELVEEFEHGSDTVSGFMTHVLGDLPKVGQVSRIGHLKLEVAEVQKMRVERLRVIKMPIDAT